MVKLDFLSVLDEKAQFLNAFSDDIWADPETAFTEFHAAGRYCSALRSEGFEVTENLAGIPTAFSGRFGSGHPVIGVLAEFDALSGLSQEGGVTEKRTAGGACGHGCGHNLLGTASLGAAIAIKRFLETQKCPGTVILFGCPGEEGGSGKAFMARDGVFDELDAALCWHPDENTGVRVQTSLANCQVLYKFNGKAAHAGAEPHLGRSALDAVELMDVGANYLREHMIDQARVHYAITDAGGFSPNVVQPHAEVLYLIRAPRSAQVKELYERVNDIARGAALMTGTTVEIDFVKACSDTILNDTLQRVLYEKMAQIGVPEITEADEAGAEPHLGRSALDAVELMDVGANYLREHMIDQARVHYAITDAGGFSPNVVQPHAEVLYLIRAPRSAQVKELYERVNDIARGAALMTGTTVEIDFVKACSDTILNDTLQRVLYEKMAQIGVPEITEADEAFARELTEKALMEYPKADPVHPIHDELLPYTGQIEYECGSTDVGDVSWVCPTVQAKAATWAFGTPCHSWQAVTQGVMPLAHKMTLYIAKSLAAMGAELMVNAELLERAKQEHRRLVGPEGYVCPIPKGVKPRSMDSLHK